jgi:superfamily I DNA/RNA helicase
MPDGLHHEDSVRFYPPLFLNLSAEQILSVGVPEGWVDAVQNASELNFFEIAKHLPDEANEALLDYAATGVLTAPEALRPVESASAGPGGEAGGAVDPFEHPDARRRFRVVEDMDVLRQALAYPWEKWTVFLHPAQREVVERRFGGPARVSGSAGTGKTVVALHRAVRLARENAGARVLLATFSKPLAAALRHKLGRLIDPDSEVAGRIVIGHLDGIAHGLYESAFGRKPHIASRAQVEAALRQAAETRGETRFSERFLLAEWRSVVDAWQLRDWAAYRDVQRLGRKTRIGGKQREALWALFAAAQNILRERNVVTWAEAVAAVTAHHVAWPDKPFDHAVIDEAQDISIPQLRFLRALVPEGADDLFFAGDLGQRIFQQPFSWLSQGVDIRGRAVPLRVNYRTSHQIRRKADQLLPMQVRDVDGHAESRRGTVSVFDGPSPEIALFDDEAAEIGRVGEWIAMLRQEGLAPEEIGVFVRGEAQLYRARRAVRAAGCETVMLKERVAAVSGGVVAATMHLAKGQEFKAVAVMACDDALLPLQARLETASEESELEDVFETERHLLYVAVTRARDRVLVTGLEPGSEFVSDLLEA